MKTALLISIASALTFLSATAFADSSVLCRVSEYQTDKQLFLGRVSGTSYLVISPDNEVELQFMGQMKPQQDGALTVAVSSMSQEIVMYLMKSKIHSGHVESLVETEITASNKGILSANLRPRGIKISCKKTF